MRFGWARVVTVAGLLLLAGCNKGAAGGQDAEANAKAAAFFMESNARAEGVQTLPSGVQYRVLQSGPSGGASPDRNDLVMVDYEGALTNGSVFDSSFAKGVPFATHVDEVVPGWTEILQRMKVGDEWMVYLPPEQGYGAQGQPPEIPANSVLVFRIKLLNVAAVPGDARAPAGTANG